MTSLRFSTMRATDAELALLRETLTEFEVEQGISVQLIVLEWATAWSDILNYTIYHDPPDVSLVGTSWVPTLQGMGALRPYSASDCDRLAAADLHLPSVWAAGRIGHQTWALPWQADTRVLFYWRPELTAAGLDEATAFTSFEQIEDTVRALTARGLTAVVGPTAWSINTLHNVAAWIWSAGGELLSPNADRVLFDQPAALHAVHRFYALHRDLARSGLAKRCRAGLDEGAADEVFLSHQAVLTQSGPWLIAAVAARGLRAPDELGIALCPGVPYNGGNSLVIWQRSLEHQAAVDLVRHLIRPALQRRLGGLPGQLPVRLDVLQHLSDRGDRFARVLSQSALLGRGLPNHRLWGVVEERLTQTLSELWRDVLNPDTVDLPSRVSSRMVRLASRMNTMLRRGSSDPAQD